MTSKTITVAGDGHFHLYPCHDPARSISSLVHNLGSLAASAGADWQKDTIFKIAFLAESKQNDYFHKILTHEISFGENGYEVSAGPEEHCVSFSKHGRLELCLVAGRQVVTAEKMEILALALEKIVPDGLPAEETVERVITLGGLPVLAFSPGKWLFKRGNIALNLIERYGNALIIGDSALRPLGWGRPAIMRRPGVIILPGSDPLPLAGDDKYAGCYGFVYQGSFNVSRPLTAMKQIIADAPSAIMPAGRRCSFINVAGRLFRLAKMKR